MNYFKIGEKAETINLMGESRYNGEIVEIIGGLKLRSWKKTNGIKGESATYRISYSFGRIRLIEPKNLRKLPDDNDKVSWESMRDIFSEDFLKEKV